MTAGIVLAGGSSRRMGTDKLALPVAGVALLDRVLLAARAACDVLVVVGPARATRVSGVEFVVEEIPGGGPAAAVAAGLGRAAGHDPVVVLAGDLPLLRPVHLERLLIAVAEAGVDAAAAAGPKGPNPLLAAYRAAALRATASNLGWGEAAASLLPAATVAVDLGGAAFNVNDPADAAAAEAALAGAEEGGPAPAAVGEPRAGDRERG